MLFCELWLHDPVCYLRTGVQNLGHPWNFNYWPPLLCALSGVCLGGGRQLGVGGDLHPRPVLGLPLGVPAPGPPAHHYHGQYKHFMNINNIS